MRELVSYAVGCIFGRYALDKPGLILISQDQTIEDYLKQVPEPIFPADDDDDNVIPMRFTDDITERFRKFLKVAFGEEHYEENLQFVEQALKEIEKITRMIAEMEEYEREVLYPLATEQAEIDLDDGVKANSPRLGTALKKIPGFEMKED